MNRLLALTTLLSTFSLSGCFDGTPDRVEDFYTVPKVVE